MTIIIIIIISLFMYLYIRVYAYIHSFINICIYLFIYIAPIYKRRSPCAALLQNVRECFYTFFCMYVRISSSIHSVLCISLYASLALYAPRAIIFLSFLSFYPFLLPLVCLHNFANVLKWIFRSFFVHIYPIYFSPRTFACTLF